ncbi:MAG: hypothetical protein ABWY05_14995, partial [Noviherbaspirillum sp.]
NRRLAGRYPFSALADAPAAEPGEVRDFLRLLDLHLAPGWSAGGANQLLEWRLGELLTSTLRWAMPPQALRFNAPTRYRDGLPSADAIVYARLGVAVHGKPEHWPCPSSLRWRRRCGLSADGRR